MEKLSVVDLEHIDANTEGIWVDIKDQTIFITGGTGFFGKWLLSSFIYTNKKHRLNNRAIVLTRDSSRFLTANPQYNVPEISYINGDISGFEFPEQQIDYIIHAATEASATLNAEEPLLMYDTIVEGAKRILELARLKKVKAVLHTSSGAVYGAQPSDITNLEEDYLGAPDVFNAGSAYGEGKRAAEMLAAIYYRKYGVNSKIARCYAFLGPYLPLDGHFAAGNFIQNVIEKTDIIIKGDGTAYRSYLYASDLAIWLWTILFKGQPCRPYNVGSDDGKSIKQLAEKVIEVCDAQVDIFVLKQPSNDMATNRYVPAVNRAGRELNLKVSVSLHDAIKKTIDFNLEAAK